MQARRSCRRKTDRNQLRFDPHGYESGADLGAAWLKLSAVALTASAGSTMPSFGLSAATINNAASDMVAEPQAITTT